MLVIGACAYTILGSITLLRYSLVDAVGASAEGAKTLLSFVSLSPVSYLARQRIAQWASRGQPAQMIEPFVSLLSAAPADGAAWLTLAEAEASAGKPNEAVVRALAMSSLTAPSEARVMSARAVFTLQIWNEVPPEAHEVFVNDLIWAFHDFTREQIAYLSAGLARLPEDARRQIISELRAAGRNGERPLRELGLQAAATPTR
jgi:hypothetical protein